MDHLFAPCSCPRGPPSFRNHLPLEAGLVKDHCAPLGFLWRCLHPVLERYVYVLQVPGGQLTDPCFSLWWYWFPGSWPLSLPLRSLPSIELPLTGGSFSLLSASCKSSLLFCITVTGPSVFFFNLLLRIYRVPWTEIHVFYQFWKHLSHRPFE